MTIIAPDGNTIDICAMLLAIFALVARCFRQWCSSSKPHTAHGHSFESRLVSDAACAASIAPYAWMVCSVGWKSMLPTLVEASRLSLGLAGLTSLAFAIRELSK